MAIAPHLLMDWNLDECNRVLKNIQAMVNRGGTAAASPTVTQTMAAQSLGASSSGGSTPINLLGDASGTGTSDIDVTVQALQGVTVPIPISAEDGYFLQFNASTGAYVLAKAPAFAEIAFAWGDASPRTIYTTSGTQRVWQVLLSIDIAFNGTAPALTIGDSGVADRLMSATQNDPASVAVYSTQPAYEYADGTAIKLAITPGAGASAGSGKIQLFF